LIYGIPSAVSRLKAVLREGKHLVDTVASLEPTTALKRREIALGKKYIASSLNSAYLDILPVKHP
jgi:hypothetical protein